MVDVSRAYFYAPVTRPLCIEIPIEDRKEGDEDMVAQLQYSLYGTRDAAQNWAATYTKLLTKLGFRQGRASSCNFMHPQRDIKLTVHGDDFLIVADAEQLRWIDEKLKENYETKTEFFGPDLGMVREVSILNRTLRWKENMIEYEADSRHAQVIVEECEVMSAKASKTPCVSDHEKAQKEYEQNGMTESEKTRFRGVAARINYLAMDRPDYYSQRKTFAGKWPTQNHPIGTQLEGLPGTSKEGREHLSRSPSRTLGI